MVEPVFGMVITRLDDEPRPALGAEMSVIGLVGTAPDANATFFPLNDPVQIYSDSAAATQALGTTGTLPDQIALINAQLGPLQSAAKLVIVRVEEGADDEETITNLVGNAALKTGIHALRISGPKLGIIPRLIGVPGYTWQRNTGVEAVAVNNGGSGYTSAPTVAFTGGGGTGAAGTAVLGTGADEGKVVSVTVTSGGMNYASAPTITFTGGGGTGAAATTALADLANAVCVELPSVLSSLMAHAVVTGPMDSTLDWVDWRETLSSDRLIPNAIGVRIGVAGTIIDGAGAVLGVGMRRDAENLGKPFRSWANQSVYGITAPSRYVDFSLVDGATEGQQILSHNGGIILRGEAGVETSIAEGGFIYVGTDNAGNDALWQFYHVTRGRDYIHLTLLKSLRPFLGREMTTRVIDAVLQTVGQELRNLQAADNVLGYRVGFERDQNNTSDIRLGRFTITFRAEEVPVLRRLGIRSARYEPAIDLLLDDLMATLETAM